jgi:hypothetical protein
MVGLSSPVPTAIKTSPQGRPGSIPSTAQIIECRGPQGLITIVLGESAVTGFRILAGGCAKRF